MKIVGMIPARSGSKGFPGKNVSELCGRPLMAYSIEAALSSVYIDRVYLNSDKDSYLETGISLGALSFRRDPNLAKDETSMKDVVVDFISCLENEGNFFDAVVVLYPTYPLRRDSDIDAFIVEYMRVGTERSLIGISQPRTHPYKCYLVGDNNTPVSLLDFDVNHFYRRQQYPVCHEMNPWACVLPVNSLHTLNAQLYNESTYCYVIPEDAQIVDVDCPSDLEIIETLLEKRRCNGEITGDV